MKGIISNILIVVLVAANVFMGALNYAEHQPKCMMNDCSRVRVSGTHYCHKHEDMSFHAEMNERIICLEVTTRR